MGKHLMQLLFFILEYSNSTVTLMLIGLSLSVSVNLPNKVFFSDTVGLKDRAQVENLQDQAILMLRGHVETNHDSSSPASQAR